MTRFSSKGIVQYDPELQRSLCPLKKELADTFSEQSSNQIIMVDNLCNVSLEDQLNPNCENRPPDVVDEAVEHEVDNQINPHPLAEVEAKLIKIMIRQEIVGRICEAKLQWDAIRCKVSTCNVQQL